MSYKPHAFGNFFPTGCTTPPAASLHHACSLSPLSPLPNEKSVEVPARHAYSHSASEGSRSSAIVREQKVRTSFQETSVTGYSPPAALDEPSGSGRSVHNVEYWERESSVRPRKND